MVGVLQVMSRQIKQTGCSSLLSALTEAYRPNEVGVPHATVIIGGMGLLICNMAMRSKPTPIPRSGSDQPAALRQRIDGLRFNEKMSTDAGAPLIVPLDQVTKRSSDRAIGGKNRTVVANFDLSPNRLRQWVKARETPLARALYNLARWAQRASVPVVPGLHKALYFLHRQTASGLSRLVSALWYKPLFQSQLERPARRLFLFGGMPVVRGPVRVRLGSDCRVDGNTLILGRRTGATTPELVVGDNVDLGLGTIIAVGCSVEIGNNVRLTPSVNLFGYPGHPVDAEARARGEAETEDQVGDIILEDDVWLASRVIVMQGVRIGRRVDQQTVDQPPAFSDAMCASP